MTPSDLAAVTRLNELAAAAPPGRIGVERSVLEPLRPWAGWRARRGAGRRRVRARARLALAAHVVQRHHGRRLRGAGGQRARGGAALRRARRRPRRPAPDAAPVPRDGGALRGTPAVLADMGVGVRVGTLVHRVLEATDFARARPARGAGRARRRGAGAAARGARRRRSTSWRAWRRRSRRRSGRCWATCGCATSRRADRLDELAFELPLVGGDDPTGRLALEAIAAVLAEHLPAGDPLGGYAARLSDPSLRHSVRGFLTGSLDLVLRLDGGSLRGRRPQDELARRAGRGADRVAPPPGRARGRDGARALRAAGAALHGRAAPLPALAAAGLRPRREPRGRPVPVPARHDRGRTCRAWTARPAACSRGSRPARWSWR